MLINKSPKDFARELRRSSTKEEKLLWTELRNRKFEGLKFLRQYPIHLGDRKFVIADFYCDAKKLVIEVDGGYHKMISDIDKNRDSILLKLFGIKTLRILNEEFVDIHQILTKIKYACTFND